MIDLMGYTCLTESEVMSGTIMFIVYLVVAFSIGILLGYYGRGK
jgi:hypothetical protein